MVQSSDNPVNPIEARAIIDESSSAKMQMRVSYYPGVTVIGEKYALLEWSASDRIKLFIIDGATGEATEVLFDTDLKGISKVSGSLAMMNFVVGGKKYRTEASSAARAAAVTAGAAGIFASAMFTRKSGVPLWVEMLRKHGVKVSYLSYLGIVGIAIGSLLLILLFVGAVFIAQELL